MNTSDITLDGNGQYSAEVIALAGGGFVVAWEDHTNTHSFGLGPNDIAGQRFDSIGDAAGTEFHVSVNYADLNQQSVALARHVGWRLHRCVSERGCGGSE
ncbi:hypothetical protein [Mesorhizobium sp. WSM2240]|uniref:hypothetical protein n=1 Tax=Mesorhizobium sp. WSM2240 TaxID=3228851 RepID=UPI00336C004A